MRAFASQADLGNLSAVWASTETKAIEAVGILAGRFGLPVHVHRGLHENDRRATGFLPPPEFDRMADAFDRRRCAGRDVGRLSQPAGQLPNDPASGS
ncbi:hypothetical protein [Microvirga ossetica]|uniref:hypothetical protein n=1 Tax=Microvirga ossetica TaxID=1882682 RepID=UPI003AB0AA8C